MEYPDRNFYGTCAMCKYMKMNNLGKILDALKNPRKDQIIELDENILKDARKSIDRMLEY